MHDYMVIIRNSESSVSIVFIIVVSCIAPS
jgi:hypothetical protein